MVVRAVPLGVLLVVAGCSGPYEVRPRASDPDPPGATPPGTAAQIDTPDCLPEGTEIPAGVEDPAPCCEGLERADVFKGSILRFDECIAEGDGHAFCIRCGDGHCGVGESTCNCEADCRWP
ncbi:MAG: hypothetical protein R3B70_08310 [Polyangiaceae bacterium]